MYKPSGRTLRGSTMIVVSAWAAEEGKKLTWENDEKLDGLTSLKLEDESW